MLTCTAGPCYYVNILLVKSKIQSDIFPVFTVFLKRKSKFKKKIGKKEKLQIYLNRFSHIFRQNLCFLLQDNSDPAVCSKQGMLVVNIAENMLAVSV